MDNHAETASSKVLIKSSFWYTVSNFLTRSMAFITIPIFTRLMTKQQYGDFSVFAGWQSIFLIICGIEIYATLNRARFDYTAEEDLNSYITSCLVLNTIISTIALLLYLLFPAFFDRLFLLDRKYMFIMFAYLYTQPVFLMFQAKQRIEYRYKFSSALSFSLIIISTLLAVGLVFFLDSDRLLGRILGQYIPYVIIGGILYLYFLKKSSAVKLSAWKYALTMGLPLVFSFLGSQILLTSDRVVVQHIASSDDVALIVLATSCAHIMLLFVQSLSNAWAPWFYDKLNSNEYAAIQKTFRVLMWLIVFATFCVLMIGPEIVAILGGREYKECIYILPANMLCGVFTTITSQFVNLEVFYKKTHYAAIVTSIAAVINIVGDIIGVMLFGYQVACYVTVFCQLILITLHYNAARKMDVKKVIAIKDLMMILIVSILLIPFSLVIYQYDVLRLGSVVLLFAVICIMSYLKRNEIRLIVKRFKESK